MQQLEQFANSLYEKLKAQPHILIGLRLKLKFCLSQLRFQYSEILEEQGKGSKKSLADSNILKDFFQGQNSKSEVTEKNELLYCTKLTEFLKKLKKSNIENLKDMATEVLLQDVHLLIEMSKTIAPISPIHKILQQIEQLIKSEQPLYTDQGVIIKCPLKEPHYINSELANQFIKSDADLQQFFNDNGFQIQRISNEKVFYYQRYLLSYVLRSSIFNLNLPPGFVARLTTYKDNKKQYSYFFILQKILQQPLDKSEFAKQYLSILCTDHLDYIISFPLSDTKQYTMYEQFKNPLLHYKKEIFDEFHNPKEFEAWRPQNIFQMFLNFLTFLSNTQLNDFHYKQQDKDQILRYKSLQITFDTISLCYQRIRKLEDTLIFVQEVLFPQQLQVRLIQITEKLNPIFFQFLRLDTSKFQTIKDYQDFINKINLEELIHKIIDDKILSKYNNQMCKVKQDQNQIDQEKGQKGKVSLIQQFYQNGPKYTILSCFQQLDIQYEISLINRIKLLDYLANLHFFLDTQFVSQQNVIYNQIIEKFNDSWFDIELWKQAFKANYSIQSTSQFNNTFYVELIAILFFKEIYKVLNKNIFESIEFVEETEENSKLLILYLMNSQISGDLGFGDHTTLVESALKHKKFYFVLQLLKNNEGRLIRNEYFNFLLDQTQNIFQVSAYYSHLSTSDIQYHREIFIELAKLHPQLEGRLRWDHFWNQIVKQHGEHQLNVLQRGYWRLNQEQSKQIFQGQQLKNNGELPSYLEINLNQIINQNRNKNYAVLKVDDDFVQNLLIVQPNYPLQKFIACQLYRLLQLDQFTSRVELAQDEQQMYSLYEVIHPMVNQVRTKVTISQYLQHNNFHEEILRKNIGNHNLSNKILLSILLFSSNISPDQELLVPCGDCLAPVTTNFYFDPEHDNLINSHGFERDGEKVQLSCYNIYFLMQYMKEKIDYQSLQNFSHLTLTLQQWLKQLSQLEVTVSQSQGLLVLPLNKENMIQLIKRAIIIQSLITKPKTNLTYLDLLKICDKNLGELYQVLIENQKYDLIQKFQELKSFSTNADSLILSDFITFRECFAYMKYPPGFNLKNVIGPYKGLKMILKYSRLLQHTWIDDFNKKLQVCKKQQHFQMLLKSFEWKNYKEPEIIMALQILADHSKDYNKPFEFLSFKDVSIKQFPQYFIQLQLIRVKILNLSFVDAVNDEFLFVIAQHCTELHVLNISGCQNVYIIGSTQNLLNIGNQRILQFQRLKTLIAQNLPNLKSVEISGQFIQNLNVNFCVNLQTVYLCKNILQRIQVRGCKNLQEEIVQLWILQGVRILFDQHTSHGAFKGYMQHVSIIEIDKEYSYEKIYLQTVFQLLSDVYEKLLLQDQQLKSPFPQFFMKQGLIGDDFQGQFMGFLPNKLDEQNKKKLISILFQCLFQNENIHVLDLKSLLKNRGQDRYKTLEQLLLDLIYAVNQSIDDTGNLKLLAQQFFLNIESITIPCTKERTIEKICQLIKLILYYRSAINVSFANLKTIGTTAIESFFEKISRKDKPTHIPLIDFSGNSFQQENLINLFSKNYFAAANVQQLILKNDGIDDDMLIQISDLFWDCENLKYVDLSQNNLTKVSLNKLLLQTQKLVKLPINTINLSKNRIGDSDFKLLAHGESKQLQTSQIHLKTVVLQNCFEEGHDISSFCELISKSQILQTLDLRQNSFDQSNSIALSKAIGQSKSLQTLYFQNTLKIENPIIVQEIVKCSSLTNVEIILSDEQQFNDQFVTILNFNNIKTLDLTLPTISEQIMNKLENLLKANLSLLKFNLNITDTKIKQRTFYKLGTSKIKNLMEIKEQSNKDTFLIDSFYKQDTLRIDIQDYSQVGLSIDGGGIRGLMPAVVINYLCTELKKEPHQIFDCIGGTSIGGILALSMVGTKDGVNPLADKDQIIKFFTEDGKTIFDDSKRGLWNIISKSKYDAKGIESVLQKYAGTVKLSETLPHTNVIVTAVKLQKEKGENMAKVFSSRKAKLDLTENFLIKDVGRATSAAPTYFPAAQIKSLAGKEYQFIDGGVGKNNPSNLVLDDLRKGILSKDQDNFFLLSISTGISKQKQHLQVDEGILGVVRILDAFGESNQDFVDLELKKNQGKYMRIVPEYNLPENQAQLDCTDTKILEEYQSAAYYAAEQMFNQEKFGQYSDKSFIRWLEENTARRLESL